MPRKYEYTVCDVCGRRFFGPSDHVEVCGNCGNERFFTDVWTTIPEDLYPRSDEDGQA